MLAVRDGPLLFLRRGLSNNQNKIPARQKLLKIKQELSTFQVLSDDVKRLLHKLLPTEKKYAQPKGTYKKQPNHPGVIALIKRKNKRLGCDPMRKH